MRRLLPLLISCSLWADVVSHQINSGIPENTALGTSVSAATWQYALSGASGNVQSALDQIDDMLVKWDDIRISGTAVKLAGNSDPATTVLTGGINIWGFSASADKEVFFAIQIPHGWKIGSKIYPHIHWCGIDEDTTAGHAVIWKLEVVCADTGDTIGSSATYTATGIPTVTAKKSILTKFLDGSGNDYFDCSSLGLSAMFLCRLYRDADNEADNYTGVAGLFEVDFHYLADSTGSTEELEK